MDNTNTADGSLNESWDDLAAYALHALEPHESARVEQLLAASTDAQEELRQLQEGAEALSYVAGEISPPASLKERILRRAVPSLPVNARQAALSNTPPEGGAWPARVGSWISTSRIAYAGSTIAMAGIIAVAVFFGLENSRLSNRVDELNGQISQSQETINTLQDTVSAQVGQIESLEVALRDQRWLTSATLNGGFNVSRWLAGNQDAPEADGSLWVSTSDNRAAFLVHGLPVQPEGKDYHLWLEGTVDEQRIRNRVAIFKVNESGQARVEFTLPRSIYDYDRAVVTLEDEAHFVPVPTGEEVLSSP